MKNKVSEFKSPKVQEPTLKPLNPSTLEPLKDGWRWVRLGEVCEKPQYGYTASAEYNAVGPKFLRITDIQNGEVNWDGVPYCRCENEVDRYLLKTGDILFARTGGTTGKSYLIPKTPDKAIFASYLIRVRTGNNLVPEYLYQFLQSAMYWEQVEANKRGGAQPNMNATLLSNVILPLPPLLEQKRISAKLQELMEEIYNLKSAINNQLEAAKVLPAAYLREVFESKEAKKWERKRLVEVCDFLDSKRIPISESERNKRIIGKEKSELYPYYGANGQIGWIDDYLFEEELVLLAEDGGFFGSFEKPIAYRVSGKYWVNNHAHILRAKKDTADVDWLYFTLAIRPDVLQFVSGTTRLKLNQEKASLVPVPLPPLAIQKRIATELKEKMEQVKNLQSKIQNQQSALDSLPQTILKKAFRGEL